MNIFKTALCFLTYCLATHELSEALWYWNLILLIHGRIKQLLNRLLNQLDPTGCVGCSSIWGGSPELTYHHWFKQSRGGIWNQKYVYILFLITRVIVCDVGSLSTD